jgi:DNA-binding transcriptional MerR regulator
MNKIFTIDELRRLAAVALDVSDYEPAESARVRAIPDLRTIRYYTTLGLVDGPAELQGRTAYYTMRHVEQLVAIKRLQGRGLTLADIQQELLGLSPAKLSRLANLPDQLDSLSRRDATTNTEVSAATVTEPEPAFWKRVPQSAGSPNSELGSRPQVARVWRINLDEHTTLEVNGGGSLVDAERIRAAARPLIEELVRQKLITSSRPNHNEVNNE